MNPVFDFLLKGIGATVKLGKGGPQMKAGPQGIDVRLPDDSDFGTVRIGSPVGLNDAVNLGFIRDQVLANWSSPVQGLTDLQTIPAFDRRDKQIREVENEYAFYQFDAESTATVPDPVDPTRTILPNDIVLPNPGRWIKTSARAQQHTQLLGLAAGDDHPQYQLRSEKNQAAGYAGLSSDDLTSPALELVSSGGIVSRLRSLATAARVFLLPDKSGNIALDDDFVGSTPSIAGAKGLVPQPLVLDRERFLCGDGTWKTNFGSLKNTTVVATAYTASKYERVIVDVTAGGVSITLPATPEDNSVVGILDISNLAGSNVITLLRNGVQIEGVADDWQLDLDGGYWELAYSAVSGSWYFLSIPAYNNVGPATASVTDTPSFTEVSTAASARATKQLVDTTILGAYANDALIGTMQIGSGQAPNGTILKRAWFEGTTNASGLCSVNTSLGATILAVSAFVSNGAGEWTNFDTGLGPMKQAYSDTGFVTLQANNALFFNKPVRFLVEYK